MNQDNFVRNNADAERGTNDNGTSNISSISLPKGGGAIREIGEKFAANPVTGTGTLTIPIALSPGRSGFSPQLALSYDSGSGNGAFGLGWKLSLPSITRKTDKGLPKYDEADESDVFMLSGAEDLVPLLTKVGNDWRPDVSERTVDGLKYQVKRYRPRIEGSFARIERWTNLTTSETHWRSISPGNVTTIYGKTSESRIADPADSKRIFSWLICESRDDKGNAIVYEYVPEDSRRLDVGLAHEKNRNSQSRSADRYVKRIKYGNKTSHLVQADLSQTDWLFEVVFDYDEGHEQLISSQNRSQFVNAGIAPARAWSVRKDPFSTFRPGFEVRTYRLCRSVLIFHHFPDEFGTDDYLVTSTEFNYKQESIASFITSVTHSGYLRQPDGNYLKQSLPRVEFEYSEAVIQNDVYEVDAENLPYGVDNYNYQFVDLDGEGLSGILTDQGKGWFYKPNIGEGNFGPVQLVALKPTIADLRRNQHLVDLAGDGQLDLVQFSPSQSGFHERSPEGDWSDFKPFTSAPNVDWQDQNLRFVDLTGDGHADILVTEDEVLTWYPSLAEDGFGAAKKLRQALDEERGPHVVFAESTQSIFVADMSGDGLGDLVRIRNGEICYWPNLGYGRFGAKVTMDGAPQFDAPDQFDQRRIRLADIDGSGVTDVIYLKSDGINLYFNQSGNSWSEARQLNHFPITNNFSSIAVADLLGNGTACLVWSSSLPGHSKRPMRYLKLMEQKPHLLTVTRNNIGGETRVQYAASTKFYLADQANGKPWITRLPFPVHVVERVEVLDHISRNRFASRYAYHHGYFDGEEREFRGFGMVEQFDTEAFADYVGGVRKFGSGQDLSPELFQPPVTTRTWYHTGAFFDRDRILHRFRDEYYQKEQHLPEAVVPPGLTAEELRECLRALKGSLLRREVYSFDGSQQEQHPYTVSENTFEVKLVQPRINQKHAVFLPVIRESVSLSYERNPADPRVAHNFALELDELGNARKSCAVVYGRQLTDESLPAEVTRDQQKLYITYTEADYTADIAHDSAYRLRVAHESRSFEITGVSPANNLFKFAEIKTAITGCTAIDYEVVADDVTPQKRLLSHSRTLFLDNNLNPMPLGQWDSLGLTDRGFRLAFTPGVTSIHYEGRVTDAEFTAAGYVHFNNDNNWWITSGTATYPADPAAHFFIPNGAKDSFGVETVATFDKYDLLVEQVQMKQATWNQSTVVNDYRVLGPVLMTDVNKNRSTVEIDVLGMVVKSAVMGKEGAGEGDTLDDPTVRMEYELFNWVDHQKPNFVHTFAREQHGAANPRWQESYSYFNGSGGTALVKAQTNPGKALRVNPDGSVSEVAANPRWIGNGRTILNNKGSVVKQYEPYFSTTHEYEDERALREIGVTPIRFYDPVGRNIRTQFPNGTFSKVEFDSWIQRNFDTNDTVKESQWYAERGSPDPATEPEPVKDPERRAAWLAAKHAATPAVNHFDSLGRSVYAIADHGDGKKAAVRSESDLTGRFVKVFDQSQRAVSSGFTSMVGAPITGESAEKGRLWIFQNVLAAVVKTWDEHGRQFRVEYDALHRPTSSFVQEVRQSEILFNHIQYGDRLPDAEQLNLLGVANEILDQAGMVRIPAVDFKGNPKRLERIFAREYRNNLDWKTLAGQTDVPSLQAAAKSVLQEEVFTASSEYDALNRPTQATLPDGTIILPTYNEANFLASLQAQIRGQGKFIEFLKEQDYDAKGQRQFAHYGNDVFTRYFYDPKTFRLTNLVTFKSGSDPDTQALQNLHYTYDPSSNITQIRDDAQQTQFFRNTVVKPENLYEYDATYQLIRASGRELAGLVNDNIRTHTDLDFVPQLPHANDINAVRNYTEEYEYDLMGNIKLLRHRFSARGGIGSGWTRHYRYGYQDDAKNRTNHLISSSLPGDPDDGPYSATYTYDAYGNMTRMPHLAVMNWDFLDQLRQVDLGGGGTAYYVYGLGQKRVRKVIERSGNINLEWIFLGPVMIFRRRRRDTDELRFERWTVHINDNAGHVAQVDTKTRDDDKSDPANPLDVALIRYQYANHLGSAVLETDDVGNVISYEEYHPYGTTSYRSAKPGFDLSLKRYRFSGKERDAETGLDYFGARYYAAWLGRWTSSDPAGFVDGLNTFAYVRNRPTTAKDDSGLASTEAEDIKPVWKIDQATQAEREVVGNPDSDPQAVLKIFQEHGYQGAGPLVWVPDENLWLDQSYTPGNGANGNGSGASQSAGQGTLPPAPPIPAPPVEPGADLGAEPEADGEPESSGEAEDGTLGTGGGAAAQAAPSGERYIWHNEFKNEGVSGAQRGRILERMYGVPWRSNTKDFDVETATEVKQIKSTSSADNVGGLARSATRDAANAVRANPTGTMTGKSPQAVVITPTDAPASVGDDLASALNPGRGRKIPPGAVPPEHVRGLPGLVGIAGKVLTGIGFFLSAFALGGDIARKDVPMGIGDGLSTLGGGLEIYAMGTPGATVLGVSAMTAGLVIGGLGIAVASGVSMVRAIEANDTGGTAAGGVGVVGGLAIAAGAIGIAVGAVGAPVLLAIGIVAALGVGIYHAGCYFDWW